MGHLVFFKHVKKNYYLTLGLLLCALLLAGLGYAFVQNLEHVYEDQARITLSAAASNVAHFYDYNLEDTLDYVDVLAKNFSLSTPNNTHKTPHNIKEKLLALGETSQRFPFIGIITRDGQAHLTAQDGLSVCLDEATRNALLLPPKTKNIYALAYTNDRGEYYSFYTQPVTLPQGEEAIFFVAKSYSSLRQSLLPPHLPGFIRYIVMDPHGTIVEGTFPSIAMGENILDVWQTSPKNSPESLLRLRKSLSHDQRDFAKIAIGNTYYYVSLAPTQFSHWSVGVFVAFDTVQDRLEKTVLVLISIGSAWFIFCVIMLIHVVQTQRREKKNSEYAAKRLQWLFDKSPCGVVRFKDDEQWTVLEYGSSFLSTIGITAKELRKKYHNSWAELVHPKDKEYIIEALQNALAMGEEITILEYRLSTGKSEPVWVLETLRLIEDESGRWFWSTIINISERKNKEIRDQNISVRYRYLFEASENILYEYDWQAQEFRTTAQFFKKFGYALPSHKADYYTLDLSIIHPDDMDLFSSMQAKLMAGGTSAESLMRLKNGHNNWIWCQLRQNSWLDAATNTTKAIGEIKNVDEETRCLQKLRDDVQRDAFTGLYNKTASTDLIQQEIINNHGERGVLCIIDVDNFKQVNDTLGHAVGDIVIKNLAEGLSTIFRSNDIVGRMGGDEYIVYLKNMPNLGVLLVKLDKVIEFFKQELEGEGLSVNISCSIGIALFPSDADNYEDLYTRADKALYRSKKKKGIYTFYDAKIDG